MIKKIVTMCLVFALVVLGSAGAAMSAECEEACVLGALGQGKLLVEVYYRGKPVPVGGLEDKVTIKVMTVEPKYMEFCDQVNGMPLPAGRHVVKVYYPGHKTVTRVVTINSGDLKVEKVELGLKTSTKKPKNKAVQSPPIKGGRSDGNPCPDCPEERKKVSLSGNCEDCPSGMKVDVSLPAGNLQ